MQRYFLDIPMKQFQESSLSQDQLHHMIRVMRMKEGDSCYFVFTDKKTGIYTLTNAETNPPLFTLTKEIQEQVELPVTVSVVGG
ncbi:RNA methyltransferase PUA domain-containing protein [Mangrovibacillus cuniculi]|uniref:RNA methyltransferase PUA domain-containing protein n=1 Tax=Mangrovibacillus cuniculi TaxID=2593652 RepID=UPI00308462A3